MRAEIYSPDILFSKESNYEENYVNILLIEFPELPFPLEKIPLFRDIVKNFLKRVYVFPISVYQIPYLNEDLKRIIESLKKYPKIRVTGYEKILELKKSLYYATRGLSR